MVGRGIDVQNENEVLLARRIDQGIRSLRTIGVGVQVVSAARSNFSMSRAPLRLKPVTSPLSSIPITSLPPAELANALIMLRNLLVILAGALSIEVLILPESGK